MRLWHESLLPFLPRQQLLGQHRECCALRGNGWGKSHATVNYVFDHSPYTLFLYHLEVMTEMKRRGYQPAMTWRNSLYRGKNCPPYSILAAVTPTKPIYPEHNAAYLKECQENLANKQIFI
ncbi:MAG TPA: TIGR02328 family protein [Arachidicoccus sp.]